MDDALLGDYDILGAFDGDDISGLAQSSPELLGRAVARARAMQRRTPAQQALASRFAMRAPGVPSPGARRMPLGFDSFTFVNAGVTQFSFSARPQVPFRGRRLIIDIVRVGAAGIAVRVDDIQVGTKSQLAGLGRISASAFQATAFDVDLGMDPSAPGIDILIVVSLSATPPVAETVTVTPSLIGDAVQ